jgi:hypothetical protein
MWVVQRSDGGHRTSWASGRDAKRYISCLGVVAKIAPYKFDVSLPTGEHVTASMMRD